jgi:hypothetical protein
MRQRWVVPASDHGDDRVDGDGLSLLHPDLGESPGDGRRNLGVHLVRRDFEDRLVPLHGVSDLLHPVRDGPLGDRLAHLGHDDLGSHASPFRRKNPSTE